ncbi:hypothetical protein ACH5RR_040379 [Cinchona calisaya]|uniref:Uncharacterized protein n=1 Tax=Cinchona calisaya TaxID=153742 RepID=A0ABD2XTR7_9GENT
MDDREIRAKRRDFKKRLAESNEDKQRETKKSRRKTVKKSQKGSRDSEDSGSDVVMLMDEDKGEEVDRNELNKRSRTTGQNVRDDAEKGEEVNPKKLNKMRRKTVKKSQNCSHDDEDSGSDIVIFMEDEKREEEDRNELNQRSSETGQNVRGDKDKGEEVNPKKLNKKRRKTVKKSQNGSRDDEDNGSDIVILTQEGKGKEVDPNELNKWSGEIGNNGQNGRDVGEGNRSNTKISREEEKGEEVHPKTLNKRKRKTVKKGQVGSRDNDESGRDDVILMEHEKGEEDDQNELNKSIDETGQNAPDLGEGSRSDTNTSREKEMGVELNPRNLNRSKAAETVQIGSDDDEANGIGSDSDSDIAILTEEFVSPSWRYEHVNTVKQCPSETKRSRSGVISTSERIDSEVAGRGDSGEGAEKKEMIVMIDNIVDVKPESFSSEEDNDDSHEYGYKVEEPVTSEEDSDENGYKVEEPVSLDEGNDDPDEMEDKDDVKMSPAEKSFAEERKDLNEKDDNFRNNAANDENKNPVGEGDSTEGKIKCSEDGLKKRKVRSSDSEAESSERDEVRRSMLQRLRPRLHSVSESKKKELLSHGISKTIPVPVSESEHSDSDSDSDSDSSDEDGEYHDPVPKRSTNSSKKEEKLPKRRSDVSTDLNSIKTL